MGVARIAAATHTKTRAITEEQRVQRTQVVPVDRSLWVPPEVQMVLALIAQVVGGKQAATLLIRAQLIIRVAMAIIYKAQILIPQARANLAHLIHIKVERTPTPPVLHTLFAE